MQEVDDPQQLEVAIAHLVTNLPSPGSESRSTPSPRSAFENQDCTNSDHRSYSSNPSKAIKLKTVTKRPPSTDIETNLYKRRKSASEDFLQSSTAYHRSRSNIGDVAVRVCLRLR